MWEKRENKNIINKQQSSLQCNSSSRHEIVDVEDLLLMMAFKLGVKYNFQIFSQTVLHKTFEDGI